MRVTIRELKDLYRRGEKIAMLTAYDYTIARIVEAAGVPIVLVGDSLGNVILGYDTTVPVTMEDMLHHLKAVARGTQKVHIVADMPFMSYQVDPADALRNAGRLMKEGGAQSVKLEGGRQVAETVDRLVQAGIPVMGHIGLTPQSVNQLGGYRVQGKTSKAASRLVEDALALQDAGVYSIILEMVPAPLAKLITDRTKVPTIGIGAGVHCDGQVQVIHDMLGLTPPLRHARRYAELGDAIHGAVTEFVADVQSRSFPADEESHAMDQETVEQLEASLPA